MNRRVHAAVLNVALAMGVFFAGEFGVSLVAVNSSASPVWLPTGLALAALLMAGYRLWPGVFIGAFLVNLATVGSLGMSFGVATGNTLEVLAGAWLMNRFAGGVKAFERARTVFGFVGLAAAGSPVIGAAIGVSSLCLGGSVSWAKFDSVWFSWWLEDVAGVLVVAPLLLIWLTGPRPSWKARRILEGAALALTVIFVGQAVFLCNPPFATAEQLEYLSIPPLLLAAFRFEGRGAITAAFFMSAIAIWGTVHGLGPFAAPGHGPSLLLLQVFIGVITLTALVLAAVVGERRRAEQRLQLRDAVSHVLAESANLSEATGKALRVLCEAGGWDVGVIWNAGAASQELVCAEIWQEPSLALGELDAATRQQTFARGVGLPGRVWAGGQPVCISDLAGEDEFPAMPVRRMGLRAVVGFPVKLEQQILGVLACFSRQKREPDDSLLRMLSAIGSQLGRFIEHKRAEELMHESEMRFRQMAENITDVFWMTDPAKNQMLYISPAYEGIWGRTCESLYASPRSWMEALHPDDRERVCQAALTEQISGRYKEVYRILRPDGSLRWIHDQAFPVRDDSGNIHRIVGIAEDVTERKLAESRLAMLGQAVESTDDLIGITDLQNRFTFVNRAFQQACGYPEAEILGKTPEVLFSAKNPPWLAAEILEQTRGEGWRGEVIGLRKDRTEFPLFLSTSPVRDRNGRVIGCMSVARDMTGQRRLEKQILEASASERRRISFDLHDGLCQHLAGVALKTKLLADSLAATDISHAEAAREVVELINDAMRQTRQVARNLDPIEVEVTGLIAALERLTSETRAVVPVDCRFHCHAPLLALQPQAGLALFQIAQEAVRNALVHGGADRIDIDVMLATRKLHLLIRDSGKGFDPARVKPEKGMGLSMMRYRADSIGGVFRVSSRLGAGTVVQCSLPHPCPSASFDKPPEQNGQRN